MYAELFLKRVMKVLQDFLNFKHLVFAQEKCLSEDCFSTFAIIISIQIFGKSSLKKSNFSKLWEFQIVLIFN